MTKNDLDKSRQAFLTVVAILSSIGLVMVYSSSYMYAKDHFGSSLYFFARQGFFLIVALAIAMVLSRTKTTFWLKYAPWINVFAAFLIALTFIPGLGVNANGANRWMNFGSISLQPGELAKITLGFAGISYFERFSSYSVKDRWLHTFLLILPLALFLLQPDFGSFAIGLSVVLFTGFLGPVPRKYFLATLIFGGAVSGAFLFASPYRVRRLLAFLDPWSNAQGSGFQVIQSWIGFANGGLLGKGPGNGLEKLFYLPEAHNDFIFAVIGEEFGLFGVVVLVLLFMAFIYFGLHLALEVGEERKKPVIATLVFTLGLQAFLNMGVVLGLLPTKGLNLPFISYGGSALVAAFMGVGLILGASRSKISAETDSLRGQRFSGNFRNN